MTPAELKATRESLGLSTRWLAEYCDVREQTVQRWESGYSPIPAGVIEDVEALKAALDEMVKAGIRAMKEAAAHGVDPVILVPETDERPVSPPDWPATSRRVAGLAIAAESGAEMVYRPRA